MLLSSAHTQVEALATGRSTVNEKTTFVIVNTGPHMHTGPLFPYNCQIPTNH